MINCNFDQQCPILQAYINFNLMINNILHWSYDMK